jgi:hypothetical protein
MPLEPEMPAATGPAPSQTRATYPWYQKLSSILLIIFCLELGCFLLFFPWMGPAWENNFFSSMLHRGYWDNGYFRGAVSGLGVVNVYIALAEMVRLRKFW